MKKCPNCGTLNNDKARFCVSCGHNLTEVPTQAQQQKKEQEKQKRQQEANRQPQDNANLNNQNTQSNQSPTNFTPRSQSTGTSSNDLGKDLHKLLSDAKAGADSTDWSKPKNIIPVAILIALIVIIIELIFCAYDLSDIDDTIGAHNNQDDNDSYVIPKHQHHSKIHNIVKLPKTTKSKI